MCGNETDAQDLVQETLIQAITASHKFRGDSAVYTWVHGILLNVSRNHYRKQKRLVYDEERMLQEESPEPELHAHDVDFCSAQLAKSLQALSPEHREVIVLRYFEELKLGEIAQQLGVSNGTVKSRLHYATLCLEKFAQMNLFASDNTHH
jgi:RNA polymerase sigma-70 factor (ECF subfamily)